MKNEEFLRLCKAKVAEYTNSHMDKTDGKQITVQDVYVVWSCKTLQNSKALLSTTVPDGMYYELTYNGDKHELSIRWMITHPLTLDPAEGQMLELWAVSTTCLKPLQYKASLKTLRS